MARGEQPDRGSTEQTVNSPLQQEMHSLTEIGPFFGQFLRAQGIPQRELARRLGVSEAAVSQDLRKQYLGLRVEKAERVASALGVKFKVECKLE